MDWIKKIKPTPLGVHPPLEDLPIVYGEKGYYQMWDNLDISDAELGLIIRQITATGNLVCIKFGEPPFGVDDG